MRSILLVGADDGHLARAAMDSDADGVVATVPGATTEVRNWSRRRNRPRLYLQVTPQSIDDPDSGPAAVAATRPDGVLLADTTGGSDVLRLGASLAAQEAILGLEDGALGVIAMITSAAGALHAHSLRECGPRLRGLAWNADAVATSIGALSARDESGRLIGPCETARGLCLLAAAAAAVPAFDTPVAGGLERLVVENRIARRDGFRGRLTDRIDQVATINAGFANRDE